MLICAERRHTVLTPTLPFTQGPSSPIKEGIWKSGAQSRSRERTHHSACHVSAAPTRAFCTHMHTPTVQSTKHRSRADAHGPYGSASACSRAQDLQQRSSPCLLKPCPDMQCISSPGLMSLVFTQPLENDTH